jgi:hypothetical protein
MLKQYEEEKDDSQPKFRLSGNQAQDRAEAVKAKLRRAKEEHDQEEKKKVSYDISGETSTVISDFLPATFKKKKLKKKTKSGGGSSGSGGGTRKAKSFAEELEESASVAEQMQDRMLLLFRSLFFLLLCGRFCVLRILLLLPHVLLPFSFSCFPSRCFS